MPSPFAQPGATGSPAAPAGGPAAGKTTMQYSDPRILSGDPLTQETEQQSRDALIAAMVAADRGATPEQVAQISGTHDTSGGPGPGQPYPSGVQAPGVSPFAPPPGSPDPSATAGPPSGGGPETPGAAPLIPGVPQPGQVGYNPPAGQTPAIPVAPPPIKVGDEQYTPAQVEEMASFSRRKDEIQSNLYAKLNEMKTMATNVELAQRQAEEATNQANVQFQQAQQMQAWAAQSPEQFAEWAASQPPPGGPGYAGMQPQVPQQQMGYSMGGGPPQPAIEQNFDPSTFKAELIGEVKNLLSTEGQAKVQTAAKQLVSDLVKKDPMFNGREDETQMWVAAQLRDDAAKGNITHQTEGWELQRKIEGLLGEKSQQNKHLYDAYTATQKNEHQQAATGLTPPVGQMSATQVPQKPTSEQEEHDFYAHASDADFNRMVSGQWEEFDRAIQGLAAG